MSKRSGQAVEEAITQFIRQNNLRPGDRLPPEREFAEILKTSRVSLRNSLTALEMAGAVYSKHGSGTFVAQKSLDRLLAVSRTLGPLGIEPELVVEARLALEPSVVALAARKATADDLRVMELMLANMVRDYQETGTFTVDHDREFHQALARGAHNPLLENTLSYLYMIDDESHWVRVRNDVLADAHLVEEFLQEHQDMVTAIRKHNPRVAESIVIRHTEKMARYVGARQTATTLSTEATPK